MSIYVEIVVRAPLDRLWAHTQTPTLHERWDLRFSRIEYLPRQGVDAPQRFRYTTRIGFGLQVSGEGETIGRSDLQDGGRSSSLRFGSDDAHSIIRNGRGYWKYAPNAGGIRFLTWYDYRTRFGAAGAAFDRLIFRPLIGWATAWSFDRLRLWLERQVDPAWAMRATIVHIVARLTLAAIFAYQGLVPKLLHRSPDELTLVHDAGLSSAAGAATLLLLGAAELAFAAVLLLSWRRRWPDWMCLGLMGAATGVVALHSSAFFAHAFNPFSMNLGVAALAAIDLLVLSDVPSASRCARIARPEES